MSVNLSVSQSINQSINPFSSPDNVAYATVDLSKKPTRIPEPDIQPVSDDDDDDDDSSKESDGPPLPHRGYG